MPLDENKLNNANYTDIIITYTFKTLFYAFIFIVLIITCVLTRFPYIGMKLSYELGKYENAYGYAAKFISSTYSTDVGVKSDTVRALVDAIEISDNLLEQSMLAHDSEATTKYARSLYDYTTKYALINGIDDLDRSYDEYYISHTPAAYRVNVFSNRDHIYALHAKAMAILGLEGNFLLQAEEISYKQMLERIDVVMDAENALDLAISYHQLAIYISRNSEFDSQFDIEEWSLAVRCSVMSAYEYLILRQTDAVVYSLENLFLIRNLCYLIGEFVEYDRSLALDTSVEYNGETLLLNDYYWTVLLGNYVKNNK